MGSSWPAALASVYASGMSLAFQNTYRTLWQAVLDSSPTSTISEELRHLLGGVAYDLQLFWGLAVLAIVSAGWSFRGRPRWTSGAALLFALFAIAGAVRLLFVSPPWAAA